MPSRTAAVFALPPQLAAKGDPALLAADEEHFAAIAAALDRSIAEVTALLDTARQTTGGGQFTMDRDLEVHRLTGRLRSLRRYGLDLCLGRMVPDDGSAPVYIGRLGLGDGAGRQLLLDWRAPAAEPFFGATHANPMGLAGRRRYRWTRGRITDYWDEVYRPDGFDHHAALDDQSAFIASLAGNRSDRMRDVLGTIQADQDAIIRAGSRGALVVDGGPGTGKTVVALHRTAYLLYSDPRLGQHRGGVLFVGPHQPYLSYISDVLPDLGEDGVQICTLRDLVPQGAVAIGEPDPEVARLKSSVELVDAIEEAVRFHEEPPSRTLTLDSPWVELRVSAADWADAFGTPEPGTPHNEARDGIRDALVDLLLDRFDGEDLDGLRAWLTRSPALLSELHRAWPLVEATDLVADLFSVPAYLRRCAPHLGPEEVTRLQRPGPQVWTEADLPLLDAARRRLGDSQESVRRQRAAAIEAADREVMNRVVADAIEADDSDLMIMSMLRGDDLRTALVDEDALPRARRNPLDGPFAHIVVDEAQELTAAQWRMLVQRCPSRSFTVVGDRAQARHGFGPSWRERLERVGFDRIEIATLGINYRTPTEVMEQAEPVIRTVFPQANVPTSIRSSGIPVRFGAVDDLEAVLAGWLADHEDGFACVIGDPTFEPTARVRSLTPVLSKGLEFDLVVLVRPDDVGSGDGTVENAVDRYVAMTRATQQLVVLG